MEPARRPEITTWPTMVGVIRTLTAPPESDDARRRSGGRAGSESPAPLRARIARDPPRKLESTDDHADYEVDVDGFQVVHKMEAVRIDLVVAERGLDL